MTSRAMSGLISTAVVRSLPAIIARTTSMPPPEPITSDRSGCRSQKATSGPVRARLRRRAMPSRSESLSQVPAPPSIKIQRRSGLLSSRCTETRENEFHRTNSSSPTGLPRMNRTSKIAPSRFTPIKATIAAHSTKLPANTLSDLDDAAQTTAVTAHSSATVSTAFGPPSVAMTGTNSRHPRLPPSRS